MKPFNPRTEPAREGSPSPTAPAPENIKNRAGMENADIFTAHDLTATTVPEPAFTLGAKGNLSQIKAQNVATKPAVSWSGLDGLRSQVSVTL